MYMYSIHIHMYICICIVIYVSDQLVYGVRRVVLGVKCVVGT